MSALELTVLMGGLGDNVELPVWLTFVNSVYILMW